MARLEIGFYDEIVAHLERELELIALEESDGLPKASMTSSTAKPKTPLSTGQTTNITQLMQRKRPYGQRLRGIEEYV